MALCCAWLSGRDLLRNIGEANRNILDLMLNGSMALVRIQIFPQMIIRNFLGHKFIKRTSEAGYEHHLICVECGLTSYFMIELVGKGEVPFLCIDNFGKVLALNISCDEVFIKKLLE